MINYIKRSLSIKILLALFLSVSLIMIAVIFFTVKNQIKEMLNQMKIETEQASESIYTGIKYPMSIGDSQAVEKQLLMIRERMKDIMVFICDNNLDIVFACHENMLKDNLSSYINNKEALQGLRYAIERGKHEGRLFEEYFKGKRNIIHVHPILNQEDCYHCHGSSSKVLGAIVIKKSTDRNYAAIANIRDTNTIISILGICSIIVIAYTLLARLISRPIDTLANDIRILPQKISDGSGITVSESKRFDEIGDLQSSFIDMALEIEEKNRAVEKSRAELVIANKELEAFAYSVSHDLRAPLRNIDGFSKILLDDFPDALDDRAKHFLKRIRNGTMRMSLLIDDMLTFSRIGRAEIQLRRTNLNDVVKSVLGYYKNEIEGKNVSIHVENLPVVKCDSIMMQSVFSNLISNALKFTVHNEKPEIVIGYDSTNKVVFVKDNGIGFDMQYHEKIFQVFQRLHLPEEYEGTGIGLAIVKRVIDRHKGSIWAESELNKSATFFVKFPD